MSILSANGRTRCGERTDSAKSHEASGLIAGIAAFTTWGLIPIYWKLLAAVPATEILAHRFVWTTIFLSIVLSWQRRWSELIANARSRRARIYCLTAGLAIASNWFLFIYAVNIGRVIETSLGYFMTPLMNVLFGAIFLRERLTGLQFASVSATAASHGSRSCSASPLDFTDYSENNPAPPPFPACLSKRSCSFRLRWFFSFIFNDRARSCSAARAGRCRSCSSAPESSPPFRFSGSATPPDISASSRSASSNIFLRLVRSFLAFSFITSHLRADISSLSF
jgi:uncharacterized membrane protein